MKKLFFLFITIFGSTTHVFGGIADIIIKTMPYIYLSHSAAIYTYNYLTIEKTLAKNCEKITDEKVLSFLRKEYSYITDKPVEFYAGDAKYFGYPNNDVNAIALNDSKIFIVTENYVALKAVLYKNELSDAEKNFLQIMQFIIQHEAGHVKNHDNSKRLASYITFGISKIVLFELIKKALPDRALIHYGAMMGLNIVEVLIIAVLSKKQEAIADLGIKTPQALQGGISFFKFVIEKTKNNPQLYWIEKFNVTHPTSESRLKKLEEHAAIAR